MKKFIVFCYDPIYQETTIVGLFNFYDEAEKFAEKMRNKDPLYSYYVQ